MIAHGWNVILYGVDLVIHALKGVAGPLHPSRWRGRTVLITLSHEDAQGAICKREQIWGEIVGFDPQNGFLIQLAGSRRGETYRLPPDPRGLRVARRGEYRLKSTGEVLLDPDFTSTWISTPPEDQAGTPL